MVQNADPMIGRVLDGRYRVEAKVARGGMATVYEATDTRLHRTVAVKVMHAGLGDDQEFVNRFEREARSAARLAHTNAVAVFDTGEDGDTLFLVMEYVPGLTLRELIRKEAPMRPSKALGLIEPVLAALAAAHDAGMIHRDVKPENVLLADDGRIKVADFGLARAINAETQHTATGGVLIGTVSYLSPELVVDGKADARSDVYSAGVLIYEMLTGQKPHQADSPIQVAYKHVHEDIPPPSAVVPQIPEYVDALVARATARDANLRPADARVLLHQVRRVKQALDAGVLHDPELVADLMPGAPASAMARTGELPMEIIDPSDSRELFDQEEWEETAAVPRLTADERSEFGGPAAVDGSQGGEPPRIAPTPKSPKPPKPQRPRRSRRGLVLLVLILAAALMVGLGGWYFGIARYTTTPGVINLPQAAAKAKLVKAELGFEVERSEYSETVAKGAVISTDPAAGSRIVKDGTVKAVVSRGPERHAVPSVKGMTLDQAQTAIQQAKLSFGSAVEQYDEVVPKGTVIRADPKGGTLLKRDAAVDVVVSKGPKPIDIIDFTGKPVKDAQKKLGELGFKVTITASEFSDTVPKDAVIRQDPSTGTGKKGDTISLVVSKGPNLVAVPDVRRMGVGAASKILKDAGFKVATKRSEVYIGLKYVLRTDPPQGYKIPKGSTVTLLLV